MEKIKYRVRDYQISEHKITKETDTMIWYNITDLSGNTSERREYKKSQWQNWCDSYEEAKKFCVEKLQFKIDYHKATYEMYTDLLNNIENGK